MLIGAIDWHPESNYIVTCAHDRNAGVWSVDDQEQKWRRPRRDFEAERAAAEPASLARQPRRLLREMCPGRYYESDNNWCPQ